MYRATWIPWVLCVWLAPATFAAKPVFEARPCEAAAKAAGARCGVVQVLENHADPRGRKISLNVMVLPATGGPRDGKRAQYDLEGGPGFAATDFLGFYADEGAVYREKRDIVLADMRGTGRSNPLRCSGIEEREKHTPTLPMYPPELVTECAKQLSAHSDPGQYTTGAAARDIDLVRRALGYEQLDLNAISYGTTLALRYMAEFPQAVHSAVLTGTVPASRTPPRYHASAARASLESLMVDCAADSACRAQFGDVRVNFATALQRVVDLEVMTPPVFLEKLRNQLYTPLGRARVPYLLSKAAEGDFNGFTKGGSGRVFADGLYLSITCAESFAYMDVDAAIAVARATPFGAYRLERQRDACRQWPAGAADSRQMRTPASRVPVLFIAGEQDPVSPAEWAEEAAKAFGNGRVVRVPHAAHVADGLTALDTCLDAVMVKFFDGASAHTLDTSCFAQMMPPAFGASEGHAQ